MANKEYEISPWKQDFPILDATIINKNPLVYLDTAASAQKPKYVLETCLKNYESEYANVHRGIHYLSEEETANFEAARIKIQKFINAKSPNEIIFTRGATEALNLIAYSFGKKYLKEGDEIIISLMEHHANIVPWQILKEEKNISMNQLSFRAEMQRTQLRNYRDNKVQRLDIDILKRLCYVLDCDLHDLIEYIPPQETK